MTHFSQIFSKQIVASPPYSVASPAGDRGFGRHGVTSKFAAPAEAGSFHRNSQGHWRSLNFAKRLVLPATPWTTNRYPPETPLADWESPSRRCTTGSGSPITACLSSVVGHSRSTTCRVDQLAKVASESAWLKSSESKKRCAFVPGIRRFVNYLIDEHHFRESR
jgi:hypothetical protein